MSGWLPVNSGCDHGLALHPLVRVIPTGKLPAADFTTRHLNLAGFNDCLEKAPFGDEKLGMIGVCLDCLTTIARDTTASIAHWTVVCESNLSITHENSP